MDITLLPAECISCILAFTSPKDACRSAAVSTVFRSAADSDALWKSFLPSDYEQIVSQSASSAFFNSLSKKALYFHLCDHPILIGSGNSFAQYLRILTIVDQNINCVPQASVSLRKFHRKLLTLRSIGSNQSFVLEKWSGRKCYMIGARDLEIIWGNSPEYWTWKSVPESRFSEVAELNIVWWFDIKGKIEAKKLIPNTNYAAYFVFKLAERRYRHGFSQRPVLLRVYFEGAEVEEGKRVVLDPREGTLRQSEDRPDGWMEIKMGEIYNELGDDGSIIFSIKEVDCYVSKSGLIVEGIEIRPVDP